MKANTECVSTAESRLITQLNRMIELQIQHNLEVHPQWDKQGYAFLRAIWIECAECLDHYGWKWWKKQPQNLVQVQLELVDIWHFALSFLLVRKLAVEDIASTIALELRTQPQWDFKEYIEQVARSALEEKFNLNAFVKSMQAIGFSVDSLYKLYIGKNALNILRQQKGYKSGDYRKIWQGAEDNVYLATLLDNVDTQAPNLNELIFNQLEAFYDAHVS